MDYTLGQVRPKKRMPLAKAEALAEKVYERIAPLAEFMMVVGSIRRRRPEIGDIEFVVLPKDLDSFLKELDRLGYFGGNRKRTLIAQNIKIEIYIAHAPEEIGAMLMTYTGDYILNIAFRSIAKRRGWKLDQYGIRDAATGEWILQSPYEEDFFGALGVDYHTPEERSFAHRSRGKKAVMGVIDPRDWSPRGEIPGHSDLVRKALEKLHWDGKEWREADKIEGEHWIWYGPDGPEGDYATEVEKEGRGWRVREYARVDDQPEPDDILKTEMYLDDEFLAEAIYRVEGRFVDEEEIRENPGTWYRLAVSLGILDLGYYGGDEEWVDSLP